MKKLLLLSAVLAVAAPSYSMDITPYVEAKYSQNWLKASTQPESFNLKDNAFGGSLAVGAKVKQFRAEVEGYLNDKAKDSFSPFGGSMGQGSVFSVVGIPVDLKTKGVFLNGYYDFQLPEKFKKFTPYVGAGIGYSWLEISEAGLYKVKNKDWGYNLGFGVSYAIEDNVDLTLGYRFEKLGEIKAEGGKLTVKNNKVMLGLRYSF